MDNDFHTGWLDSRIARQVLNLFRSLTFISPFDHPFVLLVLSAVWPFDHHYVLHLLSIAKPSDHSLVSLSIVLPLNTHCFVLQLLQATLLEERSCMSERVCSRAHVLIKESFAPLDSPS